MKKYLIAIIFLSMGSIAVGETVCEHNLRQMTLSQAEKDFPGEPVDVVLPPIRKGVWEMVCIEVHSSDEPSEVLGVYTMEVDEVCELNTTLNRQTYPVCPRN